MVPAIIFQKFKNNLQSRSIIKKFIHEYKLMEVLAPNRTPATRDEDIYNGFSDMIILEDSEDDAVSSLSIELNDAIIASQWINNFIKFVDKETITMMVDNLQKTIKNKNPKYGNTALLI